MREVALMAACGTFVGCTALGLGERSEDAGISREDAVAQQLADAAVRAEEALARLARIEAARDPIAWHAEPNNVPAELLREVTVDWTGPLAELARRLAELSGYEFRETGSPAVQPVMVDVRSVRRPLIAVLREVGLQGGTRVKLLVNAERQVVEIVHRAR